MRIVGFWSAVLLLLIVGCDIEESPVANGRIFVELRDDSGDEITGARIWLDGVQMSQLTPDTLRQVAPGVHTVAASIPRYYQVSEQVTVAEGGLSTVSLETSLAPLPFVDLGDVPDGTALIVDGSEFAMTPPSLIGIGVGSWSLSAFLDGHATRSPARWTVTLVEGDTAQIPVQFDPVTTGHEVGELAPLFALPSDGDSSIHRLQDYRGKIVLVTFFFYACAPCLAEFPHIQAVYADPQYAGRVDVLGIDAVDPWSLLNLYKSTHPTLGIQFPLLWDQTQTTRTALYAVESHPTNFLIDPSGVIRYKWLSITEEQLRSAVGELISEFDSPTP
ncbi:MAG: redoxin domain-containing protein [Calditrichaeota bacterium]|nr:redoxin domain-containing protein [Calditrichota bacterium]MCB9366493.1 redoxin domain-containing protein [Calditrichota bacterium]MCB9391249.1 redoxin domain-containing protein [Calditrichota bacterium]